MGRKAIPIEFIADNRKRRASWKKRAPGLKEKIRQVLMHQNDPCDSDPNLEIMFAFRGRNLSGSKKIDTYFFDSRGSLPFEAFERWKDYDKDGSVTRVANVEEAATEKVVNVVANIAKDDDDESEPMKIVVEEAKKDKSQLREKLKVLRERNVV